MEEDFKICGLKIILSNSNSYVVLTEKGVNGINNAKKRRGDIRTIFTGEHVHIVGQARYVNSKTIEQDLKQKKSNSNEGHWRASYVEVCHLNLKPLVCYAAKPLQKKNLETAKLSTFCLRLGNLRRSF